MVKMIDEINVKENKNKKTNNNDMSKKSTQNVDTEHSVNNPPIKLKLGNSLIPDNLNGMDALALLKAKFSTKVKEKFAKWKYKSLFFDLDLTNRY